MAGWYKDPRSGYYSYVSKAPAGGVLRLSVPVGAKYYERTTRIPMTKNKGTGGTAIYGKTPLQVNPKKGPTTLTSKQVSAAAASHAKAVAAANALRVSYPGSSGGKSSTSQIGSGKTTATSIRPLSGTGAGTGAGAGAGVDTSAYGISGESSAPTGGMSSNVDVWKLTDPNALASEASGAANRIYDPQIQSLLDRLTAQGQALAGGRLDVQSDYAKRMADLAQVMQNSKAHQTANTEATNKLYEQARTGLEANQAGSQAQLERSGKTSMDFLSQLAGSLGSGSAVTPATGLARDQQSAQAMLAGIGQMNQGGLANQQTMGSNIGNMLSAGLQSQENLLGGQFGIARDKGLRDMDLAINAKVDEIQGELGTTKSEKQAKMYELLKSLQSEDWQKYMDTAALNFNQNLQGAELGMSAQELQIKQAEALAKINNPEGSGASNMTPQEVALAYLNTATSGMAPKDAAEYKYIVGLLGQGKTLANSLDIPGVGNAPAGNYYGPGATGEKDKIGAYYARAYKSLQDRNLVSSPSDDRWMVMKNAIDRMFGLSKSVTL